MQEKKRNRGGKKSLANNWSGQPEKEKSKEKSLVIESPGATQNGSGFSQDEGFQWMLVYLKTLNTIS